MSVILEDIDLVNGTQVTLNLKDIPFARISWIEFQNESPFTVLVNCGGINVPIPAWDDYPLQVQRPSGNLWIPVSGAQEPVYVTPQLIANNLVTSMSTILKTTLYTLGEQPPITVPRSLFRQGYIPNTVNGVSGTATAVVNDGSPNNTSIVESTVTGDSASAVQLTNNGILSMGTALHSGEIILTGTTANIQCPIYATPGGVNLAIEAPNGFAVRFTVGAALQAYIDTTGLNLLLGNLFLPNDGTQHISGISQFGPYISNTVSTAYNHNLNTTPDIVLCQSDGGVGTSRTINVSFGTMTNTQFTATANSSGFNFRGIAIKF